MQPILLASASPRRAELLEAAGIPFEPGPRPATDETPPGGSPTEVVEALALAKLQAVLPSVPHGRVVLTADTLVFLDDRPLGKPDGPEDAVQMLTAMSGRAHEVATGVAVGQVTAEGTQVRSGARTTVVRFLELDPDTIEAYVATGEPLDKAGAYAIQGGASGFVSAVAGDRDTVIGLPIGLVRELLAEFGYGVAADSADR